MSCNSIPHGVCVCVSDFFGTFVSAVGFDKFGHFIYLWKTSWREFCQRQVSLQGPLLLSCKPYEWPNEWVTGVTTLLIGAP